MSSDGKYGIGRVGLEDTLKSPTNPATEETLQAVAGLVTDAYDSIELSYTGSNLTGVVYKNSGAVSATLTLAYDGSSNLISVTKS